LRVEPATGVAIGYGFLPSVSVGALIVTTVLPPGWWPVKMYGGVWAAQRATARGAASADFTSTFAGLGICPMHIGGRAVSCSICGAGQVGVVNASPSGFTTTSGGALATVHLIADAHVAFALVGALSTRVGGSLGAALLKSQFVFDDPAGTQTLYDAPVLAATGDLGLAVTLP
jgi:hypothetical protein